MNHAYVGVAWNLFLAVVPAVLGWLLGLGLTRRGKQRRLPLPVCLLIGLAWVFFLPNTCYLLTEWRHLLFDERWHGLLDAGDVSNGAMLSTAKWALLFLGYSGAGVLLFVLAIRPVERALRANGRNPTPLAPFFFFFVSLGVYLGLIVRFNTWDVLHRPAAVWEAADDALTRAPLLVSILVFAVILWGLYEAVDLWVDGLADRLRRFTTRNSPGASG